MAPPADTDPVLLALQGQVAFLRREHEDLVGRERTLRAMRAVTSADAMKARAAKTFAEFQVASKKLAAYVSKKQRRGTP